MTYYVGSLYQYRPIEVTPQPTAGSSPGSNSDAEQNRPKWAVLLMRMFVGFAFIFVVVVLGRTDQTLGTALSVFPALGTANQILLWLSPKGGPAVVIPLTGSMLVGGTSVYGFVHAYSPCLLVLAVPVRTEASLGHWACTIMPLWGGRGGAVRFANSPNPPQH